MYIIANKLADYLNKNSEREPEILSRLSKETHQKILQPRMLSGHIQGRFLSFVSKIKSPEKILEIGTGSGYQTAVLDYLNLDIYTIERDHALYRSTSNLFDKMKIKPKKFIYGDGFNGMQDHSPFDGIIVTAGSPVIPKKLVMQLKVGGRLIIPVGKDVQVMTKIIRISENELKKETYGNFRFVPMLKNKN